MRAVVQRVSEAAVRVEGQVAGAIGPGLMVLLGVGRGDGEKDADDLADKVVHLRVFPDEEGKMNRSVAEAGGAVLVVPQFTLYGDCRKGRRPSYVDAAAPGGGRPALPLLRGRACAAPACPWRRACSGPTWT